MNKIRDAQSVTKQVTGYIDQVQTLLRTQVGKTDSNNVLLDPKGQQALLNNVAATLKLTAKLIKDTEWPTAADYKKQKRG